MESADPILEPLRAGDPRALARAISWVENGHPAARPLMAALWPDLGRAEVIGLTGPPGAGKSTLTDRLARELRKEGRKVGILAVDPTSPYTGGAILGDRIRMARASEDDGIFIRSMATRGALGGLARATQDAIDLLDAAGFDTILIETVGVGQDEVDVVACVQTCCVVLVPGLGDGVQAIKAGIMEVADLFVINKADRDGADQVEAEIEGLKSLGPLGQDAAWDPPVARTVASTGEGVADLLKAARAHGAWLRQGDGLARKTRQRARLRLESLLAEEAARRAKARAGEAKLASLVDAIADRKLDPYAAVEQLLS